MRVSEEQEQQAYFTWLGYQSNRDPRLLLAFHIPNERKCSVIRRVMMKKAGVRSGVPDVFIPIAVEPWNGLFIEFKVKPNKLTELQEDWLHRLFKAGYQVGIAWSCDDAIKITTEYLKGGT